MRTILTFRIMSESLKSAVRPSEKSLTSQVCGNRSPPSGWLACARVAVLPYLQLMRLDRPNGFWYFWYPHAFGTLFAAIEQRLLLEQLLKVNLILLWGVLIMRGATCTWNDIVDVDFDRQVSRCCNRPLARGAVSVARAGVFTAVQTCLCLATLRLLLPPLCSLYAIPAVLGWIFYPLAKRVTYYPQVVLGFPMAWGVFMGAASMGADPLSLHLLFEGVSSALQSGRFNFELLFGALQEIRVDLPLAAFYFANVIWTLLYEVVYSHQDAAEDEAAGVRNLVLLYIDPKASASGERYGTLPFLTRLAVIQLLCLTTASALAGFSIAFNAIAVAGSAAALATMLSRVHLEQPKSCAWWFKVGNARYVGGAMLCGMMAEFLAKWIRT